MMIERPHRRAVKANGQVQVAGGDPEPPDHGPPPEIKFIHTGCTALDCVLGGGWALGRIFNIVGDSAAGKSLLAIEATANFAQQFPKGYIWYRESESAFLVSYAKRIGAPVDRISFIDRKKQKFDTVEEFYDDLDEQCDKAIKHGRPGLYLLDSLDALTDKAEELRKIDEGSFGANKARKLSELFRRVTRKIEAAEIGVGIVSQVRANIGATFGRKQKRSGGEALQFYCSQVLWLANMGKDTQTVHGQDMVTGVFVRARCDKNKVGDAFRQCDFRIRLNYGVDDLSASLDYLKKTKRLSEVDMTEKAADKLIKEAMRLGRDEYNERLIQVTTALRRVWLETEEALYPAHVKYERST